MKGISPTAAIWINIVYALLTGLTIPTLNALGFTAHAPLILAWAGIIAVILNGILHGFSSSDPGPAVQADPKVVKAAAALADLPATAGLLEREDAKSALMDAVNRLP
jgi:hypothetical protein